MAYKTALGGICLLGLTLASNLAAANGMDVFREDYGTLFETGNVVEFNGGFVRGYVDGNMNSPYLGSTGSVLPNIGTMSFSGKVDISNNLSAAVFIDQLHRAPLNFNNYPLLGQVGSYLHDTEYTALMRYKFNENWSLFGGPRINSFVAHVFGFGVDSSLSDNAGLGYTLGAAYEVSELGILARLSYKSSIDHSLTGTTTYTVAGVGAIPVPGPVDMRLPQSVMFDGRVPIFENTFALFAATWTNWWQTKLRPLASLGNNSSATNYDNSWLLQAGLARFLTPNWIAGVAFAYDTGSHEPAGFDTIYSDISTFSGSLTYLQDHYQITGTVGYALLGDTKGTVYGLPFGPVQANYTNNGALVLKIQALYRF